jgi:hypothetical protein
MDSRLRLPRYRSQEWRSLRRLLPPLPVNATNATARAIPGAPLNIRAGIAMPAASASPITMSARSFAVLAALIRIAITATQPTTPARWRVVGQTGPNAPPESGISNAFVRVDDEHVLALVEAVHGANLHAIHQLALDAAFVDDVGQLSVLSADRSGELIHAVRPPLAVLALG